MKLLVLLLFILQSHQNTFASQSPLPKGLSQIEKMANSDQEKAATQQNELIETISNLAGKEDKTVDQKTGKIESIKVQDLESAIKILKSNKDREQLVKVLSALAYANQESNKDQSFLQKASITVTDFTESSATFIINIVKKGKDLSSFIHERMIGPEDPEYKSQLYILILTMSFAIVIALLIEIITRHTLFRFNIHRPKGFSFKNLPLHILRTITPVILFGLVGYSSIYLTQGENNIITERGFILMTTIIMIRTSWLVVRVLFIQPAVTKDDNNLTDIKMGDERQSLQAFSYQFTLTLFQILIIGIVFAEMSRQLEIEPTAYSAWIKLIGFGFVTLLVIACYRMKSSVARFFRYDEERTQGFTQILSHIIQFIGGYWNVITGISVITSYVLWVFDLDLIAWMIFKIFLVIVLMTTIFIFIRKLIIGFIIHHEDKAKRSQSISLSSSIGYFEGSLGKVMLLAWHLLYILIIMEFLGADPLLILANPSVSPHVTEAISTILILAIIRGLWLWVDYLAMIQLKPKKIGRRIIESNLFVKTITPILRSIAHWLLVFIGIILIMSAFKIDITPLLYIVSLCGIAIALGAQGLVKDLINGILTVIEGNIAVGEIVSIGSNTGTVETLSLRGVSLRHSNGSLQSISFSNINDIVNKSRDYTLMMIEIPVPFKTEVGLVHKVLLSAFADISMDPHFSKQIIEPIAITGIDRFSDSGFVVTANIRTKPDPRSRFRKAFNEILKVRMEEENVFPPPSQKVLNLNQDYVVPVESRPTSKRKHSKEL